MKSFDINSQKVADFCMINLVLNPRMVGYLIDQVNEELLSFDAL